MFSGDKAPAFRGGVPSIEASLCINAVDGRLEWANSWGKSMFIWVSLILKLKLPGLMIKLP
nr:hypothetical protein Iba_chr02eCG4790 [Ipomoea batatas]